MLVYKSTMCFVSNKVKPVEAIYYEEIFIMLLQFLALSIFLFVCYYLIRKIRN